MDTRIAYCGLYCGACKIFMATQRDEIRELADSFRMPVELFRCRGCRSKENNVCCLSCGMRRCCIRKGIGFCGECDEFPCSVLTAFDDDQYLHHNGVIDSLKMLSEKGPEEWLKMQHQRWSCRNCQTSFHWYEQECSACGTKVPGFPMEQ